MEPNPRQPEPAQQVIREERRTVAYRKEAAKKQAEKDKKQEGKK